METLKTQTVSYLTRDDYNLEVVEENDGYGRLNATFYFYSERTNERLFKYILGMVRLSEIKEDNSIVSISTYSPYGKIIKVDDSVRVHLTIVFWKDRRGWEQIQNIITEFDKLVKTFK